MNLAKAENDILERAAKDIMDADPEVRAAVAEADRLAKGYDERVEAEIALAECKTTGGDI